MDGTETSERPGDVAYDTAVIDPNEPSTDALPAINRNSGKIFDADEAATQAIARPDFTEESSSSQDDSATVAIPKPSGLPPGVKRPTKAETEMAEIMANIGLQSEPEATTSAMDQVSSRAAGLSASPQAPIPARSEQLQPPETSPTPCQKSTSFLPALRPRKLPKPTR